MNRRPVVHPRPAPESLSTDTTPETSPAADGAQKIWHVDEPSGLPVPVIRANMISFRRSYQGRVKVTFFEQE